MEWVVRDEGLVEWVVRGEELLTSGVGCEKSISIYKWSGLGEV